MGPSFTTERATRMTTMKAMMIKAADTDLSVDGAPAPYNMSGLTGM
jgi:hypothetical protein